MPANPFDPAAPEISANIPLMVGSVETESVPYAAPKDPYWTTTDLDDAGLHQYVKRTLQLDDATTDRIVGIYREGRSKVSNLDLAMILASDAGSLRQSAHTIAELKARQNKAPAYLYYFNGIRRFGTAKFAACMAWNCLLCSIMWIVSSG